MIFDKPLVRGHLIRRYKRFLADVTLEDGRTVTAHCANPGSMMGLSAPGLVVWLEPNNDPRRKLRFAWRLVELPGGHLAGIDTGVPNRIVKEALRDGRIVEVAAYTDIAPETRYDANSRVDFLLRAEGLADCYLEVKNCHLRRDSPLAEFPDCVTVRGAKHLDALARMVEAGHRAVMLYVVQRSDCQGFAIAADIDPGYAAAAARAKARGVETLVYQTVITRDGIALGPAMAQ